MISSTVEMRHSKEAIEAKTDGVMDKLDAPERVFAAILGEVCSVLSCPTLTRVLSQTPSSAHISGLRNRDGFWDSLHTFFPSRTL